MDKLFDLSLEYDAMLNQGLKVSGETKTFFIHGRIQDLLEQIPIDIKINKILDFGCGIGDTTIILKKYFKDTEITGTDLSVEALKYAQENHSSDSIRFIHLSEIPDNYFDLVYVNGVFHHIEPENRDETIKIIYKCLTQRGLFSLFENNPWNPGTKLIMKRIPFDRDAQTLSSHVTKNTLKKAGFEKILTIRFLFYFPKFLSIFRFSEKWLTKLPFGAQYYVLAQKI